MRDHTKARLCAAMLVAVMAILTACGGSAKKEEESKQADTAQQSVQAQSKETQYVPAVHEDGKLYVGVLQQAGHEALEETADGFEHHLKELMGEDVVIDIRVADGTKDGCDKIMQQLLADNDDLIVAEGTAALQSASEATKDVPIIGAAVTDFIVAGGVSSVDEPGGNVSGVSDLPPMVTQKDAVRALAGDGSIGIVFDQNERGARFQSELMEKFMDDDGMDWTEYRFDGAGELESVLEKACDECGTLYLPADNTLAMNMSLVREISVRKGVKVFTAEKGMCLAGGLATISVDYYELGVRAADMAYDALVYGTEKGRDMYNIGDGEEDDEDDEDDDRGDLSKTSIERVKDTAAGYYNPAVAEELDWMPTGEYSALEVESSTDTAEESTESDDTAVQ